MIEIMSRERSRGDCFRLLAACFYQPDRDKFLAEQVFEILQTLLQEVSPDAAAAAGRMAAAFHRYSQTELAVAHAKLFVGPQALIAPPYGSVYLDNERKVMGDSTIKVIETYREHGLVLDRGFKELPDHIAVELEFVYYLAAKEVAALESSQPDLARDLAAAQERFLDGMLGKWAGPFCDAIREGIDNEFYIALADCLDALVRDGRPAAELVMSHAV